MKTLLWFRNDLRIEDNEALSKASKGEILPVYIYDQELGSASKWYLHHALKKLEQDLKSPLYIAKGKAEDIILELTKKYKIENVYWNRLYEPELIKRDKKIKSALKEKQIEVQSFSGFLLVEPWKTMNKSGKPYQVFTPFWRNLNKIYEHKKPLSKPRNLSFIKAKDLSVEDLKLLPEIKWDNGFSEYWDSIDFDLKGEFKVDKYLELRNFPSIRGTSQLSPALHFGQVSPRMLWDKALKLKNYNAVEPYLRQLAWRDFANNLLFHFPKTVRKPLRDNFKKFPWRKNKKYLTAWQKGVTGYPIVDAGMRELWQTGWMHNRVRMIVGSFLVKNLLLHWHNGADWFMDTLVDADLANNTMGWQWIAGCGADAAPYFRVFNPVLQGERFDKEGAYVKKWIPELEEVPKKWVHKIWQAPDEIKEFAKNYPEPIVDLAESRDVALEAYYLMKDKTAKENKK